MKQNNEKVAKTINIAPNIVESSSTAETTAEKQAREYKNKKIARRRAKSAQHTSDVSSNADKRYDVLALYHQLNYIAVQAAIKELNMKPVVIDNTHLWLIDLSFEEFEKVKNALIKCHFETKQHKQYKVRVAGYKHNAVIKTEKREKKPTNNKPEVAAAAKAARKANNKRVASNRGRHLTGRKANKPVHTSGTRDTSSLQKKLSARIKKACRAVERKEQIRAIQAKSRANKGIPAHKIRPVQKELKFAA